jgi:hypothetical protein
MSVALLTSDDRHSPRGERIAALAERLDGATVVSTTGVDELSGRFDFAVAFGWHACVHLGRVDADTYAYFVPALEDAQMWQGDERRLLATITYGLPVPLITESAAVADELRARNPDAHIALAPRGFDKAALAADAPAADGDAHPLRILVAGDASAVLARMEAPVDANPLPPTGRTAAYARADVLLEILPPEHPLDAAPEAMHAGCVPVVAPVRGHADYVEDGTSGVVVAFDDVPGAARALDLLARDRGQLAQLRAGALAHAAKLPSLDDAAQAFQRVLAELPRGGRPPRQLLLNAVAAVEVVGTERRALEQYVHELEQRPAAAAPPQRGLLRRLRRDS